MPLLERIFPRRTANYRFLRSLADSVGKEIEVWPYDRLRCPAEEISFSRVVQGTKIHFSIEQYEQSRDGDIHICIDVDAGIPLFPLPGPSYMFWKRSDGTVYY